MWIYECSSTGNKANQLISSEKTELDSKLENRASSGIVHTEESPLAVGARSLF